MAALALWACLWITLPTWLNVVPPSDNIEQLVWSQGFELGYHKHPPLPTWILIGAEHVLPASVPLTYVLSILAIAAGGFFLWRFATELLGEAEGVAVVLTTACIAFYSHRAHIYNHNTVLIPFGYASAWYFLRAVRAGKALDWGAFGLACAAGLLTKYQFGLLLVCFAVIAIRLQLYRSADAIRGALISLAVAIVVLSAHIWWLFTHDFLPFRYAGIMVLARLGLGQRLDITGSFVVQEMRDLLTPIAVLWLAVLIARRRSSAFGSPAANDSTAAEINTWAWSLGAAPLGILILLGLVGGVRLENHWGTTAMQFVALPMVAWLRDRGRVPSIGTMLAAFIGVQLAQAAWFVADTVREDRILEATSMQMFDPAVLSAKVLADWHRVTAQPLRYIVGPTMFSGFASVYSTEHPQVLIDGDPRAAPWVSIAKLTHCGGVYISPTLPPDPASITLRDDLTAVDYSNGRKGLPLTVNWVIVPPDASCGGNRR